jgi:uncharacterized membrane protein YpjA
LKASQRNLIQEFGFATLAWLIPLAVSICLYPLQRIHSPLFDSLMGVTLVLNTAVLACLYLRRAGLRFVRAGVKIGILWMAANWALDGLMFSRGPMKMSLHQYAMQIGIGDFMIPVITIAMGTAPAAGSKQNLAGSGCAHG